MGFDASKIKDALSKAKNIHSDALEILLSARD